MACNVQSNDRDPPSCEGNILGRPSHHWGTSSRPLPPLKACLVLTLPYATVDNTPYPTETAFSRGLPLLNGIAQCSLVTAVYNCFKMGISLNLAVQLTMYGRMDVANGRSACENAYLGAKSLFLSLLVAEIC